MDWVIADLHGMLNTTRHLVDKICSVDDGPHFIFVGDYPDRGPFSRETVDYLLDFPYPAEFLRGNHDDVLDYLLNGQNRSELCEFVVGAVNPASVVRWWMPFGFASTLDSYGVPDSVGPWGPHNALDYTPVAEAFRRAVPESHKQFYRDLKLFWSSDAHFACHAYFRPNEELPRDFRFVPSNRATEVLWGRFAAPRAELPAKVTWSQIGVFGHNSTRDYGHEVPIARSNLRLIDTFACGGGTLTAYCCQTDHFLSVPAADEDLRHSPGQPR
jgi:serine/threonine protein phosphatase 1